MSLCISPSHLLQHRCLHWYWIYLVLLIILFLCRFLFLCRCIYYKKSRSGPELVTPFLPFSMATHLSSIRIVNPNAQMTEVSVQVVAITELPCMGTALTLFHNPLTRTAEYPLYRGRLLPSDLLLE